GGGRDESVALDAVDEALGAQLLRATGAVDSYDFTHALIRHTLYAELNPSRQVRLHRRIAEAMAEHTPDRAADIAYHYHRSAAMSGAEAGRAPAPPAPAAAGGGPAPRDRGALPRVGPRPEPGGARPGPPPPARAAARAPSGG